MKKCLSLALVLALVMSFAGCSLFNNSAAVKFDDTHTHSDPKGLTYDERLVLKNDKFGENLQEAVNSAAYPDNVVYDEKGNMIGMYDYDPETGLAAGWTKMDDGSYTAFEKGKEKNLGKPDASKMIEIPGTVTMGCVVYGNKQSAVSAYIYLFLSDASAKKLVTDNMKSVFDLTLTEDSDTVLKCVQDADAIAQQFTQMEQQGETIKTKDAATYADILQQTYGVKKYTGENPYKPYAGHKDPTDIEFDQRVVLTGDGQAAVQEEYSGDISSMTDYLYGLKGDMVAQYSYYETPSKESADKLMEAKAFGNNMVRESDTVIKVVNTGKDLQDLLNTYKGYSVIKDNSVKEYTRMIEETFFSTVCE